MVQHDTDIILLNRCRDVPNCGNYEAICTSGVSSVPCLGFDRAEDIERRKPARTVISEIVTSYLIFMTIITVPPLIPIYTFVLHDAQICILHRVQVIILPSLSNRAHLVKFCPARGAAKSGWLSAGGRWSVDDGGEGGCVVDCGV